MDCSALLPATPVFPVFPIFPILPFPISFLNLLYLLLAQPKVVAELMNERLSDRDLHVLFTFRVSLDWALEQHDLIGQCVAVIPTPLRQRGSLVEAEERIRWLDVHLVEKLGRRFVFNDDRDVVQRGPESPWNGRERVADQFLEAGASHFLSCSNRRHPARRSDRRAVVVGKSGGRAE